MRVTLMFWLVVAWTAPASAQSSWSYRARIVAESTSTRSNGASPLTRASTDTWQTAQLFVATTDGAWTPSDRLRVGGAFSGTASSSGHLDGRLRELFARISVTPWLEIEAGKRIARWGVGYGFSPAGVLDPPRVATDPSDRLQLKEGRLLARADLYRGGSSVTVAAWKDVAAARVNAIVRGVDIALIGAAGNGRLPQYAGTLTHVIGDRLEWHAEALVHDDAGSRVVSGAAGFQYTLPAEVNVIVEYHRNGRGLNGAEWNAVLSGRRSPGDRPARENFLFLRAARAGADEKVSPELIVIAGLDDNGWTLVPALTWTPRSRVQVHIRATRLTGARRSVARSAPFSTLLTAGASVRF